MTDETGAPAMTDDKNREFVLEKYQTSARTPADLINALRGCVSVGVHGGMYYSVHETIVRDIITALSRASVSLPVTEDKMREALESIIQSDPARANEVIKTDEHWEIVMGWLEKAAALTPASPQSANAQTEGK